MKKTEILKKNYEFKNILNKGKYCAGKYIDIIVLKNNMSINMLGIAVSKKSGNSVTRNRVKRLIRENYRILEGNISLGYSLVIMWKKREDAKKANYFLIKKDIEKIFEQINILRKEK